MEIEEPRNKADIIREDDAYGRTGQAIEMPSIAANTQTLTLSTEPQTLMGHTFKIEQTMGGPVPDLMLDVGGQVLGIYRERGKKVSDLVADFVKSLGIKHVFGVTGGGAMHLDDSFHDLLVTNHHEQASAMAADAYARLNGLGCCLVTTGPGGTNAVTGVSCSWIDSIPVLYISGQVTRDTLSEGQLRQRGVQETNIVKLVSSITKYAVTVMDEKDIRYQLERAVWMAKSGRPGPVWVDIPLDVQAKTVDWDALPSFTPPAKGVPLLKRIPKATRPVVIIGNGVRLSGAADECLQLLKRWQFPVVSSWLAADIIESEHPLYIGRAGIFGDRASNFAVQNADLLVVLGSRLSIPQTGHNLQTFARGAKIFMVDAEPAELRKFRVHHPVVADVKDYIRWAMDKPVDPCPEWLQRCRQWKARYPVVSSEKRDGEVNSFRFVEALSASLSQDATVVTDMGTSFTCTFQAGKMQKGQRWFTAAGHAPMGYGLPGAIGAHYATGRPVTCLVGDGALMFNLQELQSIGSRKLPIVLYVICNGGYLTMKHTFWNHFGRLTGSDEASGVSFPEMRKLAECFGFGYRLFDSHAAMDFAGLEGPVLVEVRMPHDQPLIPRSSSLKRPDGSIVSKPLEDLYPFLPREEFNAQMIVPPVEVL